MIKHKKERVTHCSACGRSIRSKGFMNKSSFLSLYCSSFCSSFVKNSFINMKKINRTKDNVSKIIALAWADEVPFDSISYQYGLSENDTIRIMRSSLKPSSFRLWRKRVSNRKTKHKELLRKK